jgi:hypothetical protein
MTGEPSTIQSGDTVSWTASGSDYTPADGWDLTYYIRGAVALDIDGVASTDQSEWTVTLTAAQTGTMSAGTYSFVARVSKDSDVYTVSKGFIQVETDLAAQLAGYDARSHIKKVLDAIEAVMERRATKEQESTQLPNGVAISLMPMADLIKAHENYSYKYEQEIDTNRVRNGGARRKILTSFT